MAFIANAHGDEERAVWEFLEQACPQLPGYFVDVGANHPTDGSQTWHLEQRGWRGILIEPTPAMAKELCAHRKAAVFDVACSTPENAGKTLPFHIADNTMLSGLDSARIAPWAAVRSIIDVPVRTLDSILEEAGAPEGIDFLSVDVEGHETEVLSGFDFVRWKPRFILLEDHVGNLRRHRFMRSRGYRLVRRTGLNGWYIPEQSPISFGLQEEIGLMRKYYLWLPFRKLRNFIRGKTAHYTA